MTTARLLRIALEDRKIQPDQFVAMTLEKPPQQMQRRGPHELRIDELSKSPSDKLFIFDRLFGA